MSALEDQVGGKHYQELAIQPAEYCQKNKLGFCESSVVKYVSRHRGKNGKEDIQKAIHFLEILLELEYGTNGKQAAGLSEILEAIKEKTLAEKQARNDLNWMIEQWSRIQKHLLPPWFVGNWREEIRAVVSRIEETHGGLYPNRDFKRIAKVAEILRNKGISVYEFQGEFISALLVHETPEFITALSARLSHESWDRMDFGEADEKLMNRLEEMGDQHAKGLRGKQYFVMIEAPRYFWAEFDTYTVGTEGLGSTSTMHKEARKLKGEQLVWVKERIPEGTLQLRSRRISQVALKRMVRQRDKHRLPEWNEFCEFARYVIRK